VGLLDIFFLLRVPLLVPVWTVLLLGWVTGRPSGGPLSLALGTDIYHLWLVMGGFSLVVASIYVVNQIADIDSDRINHKLFLLPQGIVGVGAAWVVAGICACAGIALAVHLGLAFVALFAASLLLGVFYNLPPARLKDCAWGGVIANSLGHGMLTYLVGWCAARGGAALDSGALWAGLLSSLAPACANGAVFLATTIPDAGGDRATDKRTFSVRYGEGATARVAAVFCAAALLLSWTMQYNAWVMAVPSALSMVLFVRLALRPERQIAFSTFRMPVALLSIAVAVMVPWYAVMVGVVFLGSRYYYRLRFGIEYPTLKSK
jgi:4-hydroxybenzoate polyprenyltransferase